MEQSILKSTKKILGIALDDDSFDVDVITHINAAFSTLNDIGVGFESGFAIEDETPVWTDFLADELVMLSKVKSVIYLRVRLLFDPPTSGFMLTAMQEQLKEAEWRLNVNREATAWTDPTPTPADATEDVYEIDGGVVG